MSFYVKYIFFSPTHGTQFNGGLYDDFPEDDITPELKKINEKNIHTVALRINEKTDHMYDEFKKILGGLNFDLCNLVEKGAESDSIKSTIEKITKCVTGSIKRKLIKN